MTRRYTSGFDILGFDTDPTPGDPDLIMTQIVPTYQSIGDDAEMAVNALNSSAVENGVGQTMQALQNLIGTSFPPKLQTAADSYHSAASVYTAYAGALTEAQNQLDRAMDQAVPVAAMANATVPPAPPNASADQVSAVQQQQQSVDQANDQLTAAKQLAQDAQEIRTQAGNTFNTNLSDVSSIPAPTPPSFWQDFLNFFNNTFFQIFVDIAIAAVSIFFPVVGLALGAVFFGLSTAVNIASGHFDVGSFVVGLLTLAGGGFVAFKAFASAELLAKISGGAAKVGNFFASSSGSAAKGILNSAKALVGNIGGSVGKIGDSAKGVVGKIGDSASAVLGKTGGSYVKNAVGYFAYDSATGLAGKGIGDAINHEQFTAQDAEAIFAGAAAGGVVGGAFGAGKTAFGLDPDTPSPGSSGPPDDDASSTVSETGSVAGSDVGHAYPDDASSTHSETGDVAGSEKPLPPLPGQTEKPLPPLPGQTNKGLPPLPNDKGSPPLPWKGVAVDQAGRIGNDVANSGAAIAAGQAIGNTTGHQQDPPGQQGDEYAYSDLPSLAIGDITGPPNG